MADGGNVSLREEPADGEAGASLLAAFDAEIATIYPDWDPTIGPSARPSEFAPPAGCFVVAYQDGVAVAGGGFKRLDARTAEIKRMFVAPDARGRGVARLILRELERIATVGGYALVRLDTGPEQPHALALYESEHYHAIGDYNGNPFAAHWFEKPLR
jgi:GNAT superfamily N-acetyltransferase